MPELTVEGYEYEIDDYSIVDGEPSDSFDLAGGTVILRGRLGALPVTATVSGANLPQALGQAVALLLRQRPEPQTGTLHITAYIDGETGEVTELDRRLA